MNYIKRFVTWIIRGICFVAAFVCLIGAIFSAEYRIGCIIGLVVCVIVGRTAGAIGKKAKAKSINKCKKCGSSYSGANYKYKCRLSKTTESKLSGLYVVPVDIEVTCPNCGKIRYLYENVEVASTSNDSVEEAVSDMMETYMNNYND